MANVHMVSENVDTDSETESVSGHRLTIPYENHVGAVLKGNKCRYQINSRCWEEADDLLIFSVTCLHDEQFEVQAFRNCDLPPKLFHSRKRRYKRLQRSSSIHDECEQSEMRIVVCRTFGGGGIDRHRIAYERRSTPATTRVIEDTVFPQLNATEVPLDRSLSSHANTYAEAVSQKSKTQPNCPLSYLSKTNKGSKQRERRINIREQKRKQDVPQACQHIPAIQV